MFLLAGLTPRADAFILINEILADPPSGIVGDANNDGETSSSQDEFVELFNAGPDAMDLSAWTLEDSLRIRHVFSEDSLMDSRGILVIFGGGTPQLSGIDWQLASSGALSLNNSSDTVILRDHDGNIIDQIGYSSEAGQDQSLTRSPEGELNPLIQHTLLDGADGLAYSAGFFVNPDESPADTPEDPVVPELSSFMYLSLGLLMLAKSRITRIAGIF